MQSLPETASRFDRLPAWRRAATLVVTILAICLVLLLVAEAGVRIRHRIKYGDFSGIEATYKVDPASGLRIPIPGHFGPISINSFGFRSPEITEDKRPGQLRIAFLGGSTTYCGEVSSNEMTWPHLVWKALHQYWPALDLDYINAGVPGYTTRTLLRGLETRVAQFKPDVIVIYEATNDLSANSYQLARDQGVVQSRQEENLGWLARHSLFAYLLEKNFEVMREQRLANASTGKLKLDTARLDAEFRRDYANLVEASEKVAKIVVTATFSPRLRAEQSPAEQKEAAASSLYYMPYMRVDDLITAFSDYNQVIRDVAKAHRALLVGEEDAIPADRQHYTDSVHFTDAGSASMADRVSRALIASPAVRLLVADTSAGSAHKN